MRTLHHNQFRWPSAPYGLRLLFALVLALVLVLTLNAAQGWNVSLQHGSSISALEQGPAVAVSDLDHEKDEGSGAVHIHAHCGCHATYAFQAALAQPDAPMLTGHRFALTLLRLASRDPSPIPEPPRT